MAVARYAERMNAVLQNEVQQLSANEKLELAKWLIEDAQAELEEMPTLPELTPAKLLSAIDRAIADPRRGYTVDELFQSFKAPTSVRSS
jgi:hypothetical protein